MCIRDSNNSPLSSDTLFKAPSSLLWKTLRRRLRICLLYTSDAADDLLCVDLGGRRIIKKNMASQDYLIAIALIEQNNVRAMPLGGKEIKSKLEEEGNLNKLGEEVILNLLLRVFQRSDEGALKRVSEDKGLLLVLSLIHI